MRSICSKFDRLAFRRSIEKPKTKRARHSEAAVVRRASAEADDDFADTTLRRVEQHLARAKRTGAQRIALVRRDRHSPDASLISITAVAPFSIVQ